MKIQRHGSLEVATAVVETVELMITDPQALQELMVYSFSNGREQGLVIKRDMTVDCPGLEVAIAQHKTTDSIAVYYGQSAQFDFTTNHPKDWDQVEYFAHNELVQAALFILGYLFYEEGE